MIKLRKLAAFTQYLGLITAYSLGLSDCAEQSDEAHSTQAAISALRDDADDADGGTIIPYQPCVPPNDACGGNNALCASYVADPDAGFCAPFCQLDLECPVVPGFEAGCNFAWCAILCDDGRCPVGMACVREVSFLDFRGNERGTRDVCVTASQQQL